MTSEIYVKHRDMIPDLLKPEADIRNGLTSDSTHLLHMAVGISGEVAELLQPISVAR